MALVYIYSDSTGSTIDITDRCRTYVMSVKDQAEEGAVAISKLIVDDPDGDIEFTGHRRLYIYEDTAPVGDQIIFNGFVFNERVIRGPSGRTGASRQWVLDLADVNVLINRRIMNGEDANRTAENDTERILALLTMTELNTVDDDSMVSLTAATTDMDAADYRGQNVGNYIDDCRQASGKNAYIYYNETLGEYGLWYDFDYSAEFDSGKFLSNDLADIDNDLCFGYSIERTYLNRDPSRVASGIYLEYDGGKVYVQDASTLAAFAAIDWAAPSMNVKTDTKATARANRYLADAATEDEVVHVVMTDVPRAKVNYIKKGYIVRFKSTYMPGYEDFVNMRVLYRTVNEISEDPNSSFEIEMDLTPQPPVPIEQYFTETGLGDVLGTWPEGDPGADNLFVGFIAARGPAGDYADFIPWSVPDITSDEFDVIAGTDWTHYNGAYVDVSSSYPIATVYRYPTTADDTQFLLVLGVAGGSGRPRGHFIEVAGLLAPTTGNTDTGTSSSSSWTSPNMAVPGAGTIFVGFSTMHPGPADNVNAPPGFVIEATAPAEGLTRGYAHASFRPYSWFGRLEVAGAGTYTVDIAAVGKWLPGTYQYGWAWLFCPNA